MFLWELNAGVCCAKIKCHDHYFTDAPGKYFRNTRQNEVVVKANLNVLFHKYTLYALYIHYFLLSLIY